MRQAGHTEQRDKQDIQNKETSGHTEQREKQDIQNNETSRTFSKSDKQNIQNNEKSSTNRTVRLRGHTEERDKQDVQNQASCCKYLGFVIRSDLSWADQVNYTVQESLEGTTFRNAYCKNGKLKYEKFSLYVTNTHILEYGAACWDPYTGMSDKCFRPCTK